MDESEASSEIDPKQAKRRARWRRNKADERMRKASPVPPLQPIPPALINEVWAERNRRYKRGAGFMWPVPGWRRGRGTLEFQCDVWAVRTLLAIQWQKPCPSHAMIARWMAEHDLTHGYAHGEKSGSLRTMIGRALAAIDILENRKLSDWATPAWPKFNPEPPPPGPPSPTNGSVHRVEFEDGGAETLELSPLLPSLFGDTSACRTLTDQVR